VSTAPLRLGLVGCGRLAERGYLPALARVPSLELAAVVDHDPVRREHLAALAGGVGSHESLARALARPTIEALVLATPAPAHLPDARLAAARGVPTLVEKPPAPDAVSAAALAELRPAPLVGFNRRFDPGVASLLEAVDGSKVAELRLDLGYRRAAWGSHQAADDALLDLGPHLVDLARWLSGSPVRSVRCRAARPERIELELELERGRARLRCSTQRPWRERFEARDGSGRVIARHRAGGLRHAAGGVLPRPGRSKADHARPAHPLVESLVRQLEAFAATARGGPSTDLATAGDGAAVMAAIDAARRSARHGGRPERPASPPESSVRPARAAPAACDRAQS
jgi:predicted dehydrogenase